MLFKGLIAAAAALALSLPVALAADPARVAPGQRVDLKVLLLSADGTESGFDAWKAALDREGVPYDTFVAFNGQTRAATLTDAQLADYSANHARYQAVILATGDLGHSVTNPGGTTSFLSALSDTEWATLAMFERTFGIRRLSDYTAPSPAHGLSATTVAGDQDGRVGLLTAAGRAAFPYLKGPVSIANDDPVGGEAHGYPATPDPANPSAWQTLVSGPGDTAYLGIHTHKDDGREEMVMTVASNQFQNHNQLLRHGMLNWVTRGVYLGYQRNYLELQVDDLFLGDDAWDPTTNTTNYDPATASRMTPADVDRAIAWSRARGLRIDMAYNGGGSALYVDQTQTADPLAAKFADPSVRNAFGYVNHTLDHPNLDCSTSSFIARQITSNLTWASDRGLPVSSGAELVTGEHSGLANARPGNPGTIDPPTFSDVQPVAGGGAVPAGSYDYALTARNAAGETVPSIVTNEAVPVAGSVSINFNAVCHATGYDVYRRPAGTAAWARVATLARAADAPTDNGTEPIELTVSDTAAADVPAEPPTANGAALAPYGQNPAFLAGINAAGVRYVATDASKAYPSVPTVITSPLVQAGASFTQGAVRAVPRYPSNVYYNVSRQGQQLDEYNWIYVAPANGGGCVPITGVTTCRTAAASWDEYVGSETRVMFRHVADNDPRPHFFHQSNLADYNPALPDTHPDQGGILYPVIDALVSRYDASFDRTGTPLVQLTSAQVGDTLARRDAWLAARGSVSAWLQDGRVYVRNSGGSSAPVPLTGTTAGELYGGQRSGWVSVAASAEAVYAPADPANTTAPSVTGEAVVGGKLSSATGAWTGTPVIGYQRQWQRCNAGGAACVNIAGATGSSYDLVDADQGRALRVAVLAGNWISSVSQAVSAPTAAVKPKAVEKRADDPKRDDPRRGGSGGSGGPTRTADRPRLRMTSLKMSPRRFAVAHRRAPKGTRLDGARVSWKLNRAATVRLTFQQHTRKGYKTVGRVTRSARAGSSELRFRGRFGKRLLKPQRYRVVVTAGSGGDRTAARRLGFRVVKG